MTGKDPKDPKDPRLPVCLLEEPSHPVLSAPRKSPPQAMDRGGIRWVEALS